MPTLPVTRVVLYKHGVGYFEREGAIEGDTTLSLTFKQAEVSDVLKSLTALDLNGGHIASVSYDSTKPLEQLLAEVALSIPDQGSLVGLLPQLKGARVRLQPPEEQSVEGIILGIDLTKIKTADGVEDIVLLSVMSDAGEVRSFDLHGLIAVTLLDEQVRRDLDYYLRTQLSAKKKDSRTFTFFAEGKGSRTSRLSYTLVAPVWKATYRILLGEEDQPPLIQGWAVVDNTQDEDWDNVRLSLVAGLPVSFIHDLYTPRYIRRPVVAVQETTGVLPPEVEEGMVLGEDLEEFDEAAAAPAGARLHSHRLMRRKLNAAADHVMAVRTAMASSTPAQVRERKIGDLFEYEIEHPVTIRRNQSALVPIVLQSFKGRPVLLYNKETRAENPMRCVEFENTTGLTLEGGPVTVLEGGSYVGEAMLDTLKPDEKRLVPFAVELGVSVLDNIDSHEQNVHRVVIRKGVLKAYSAIEQKTTYTLNNKSDVEQTVFLDHPRQGNEWKLFDTSEPVEITENYWRFRFALPAKKVTRFAVNQKQVRHAAYSLNDLSNQQLAAWLEQRYLDKKTSQVLGQVVELRQQAAGFETQIQRLEKEREKIHQEQKRIRENLQSLGDRPSEKELRERFVKTLNAQEDRLESIDKEISKLQTSRDQCREKMNEVLAKLEYEAEV